MHFQYTLVGVDSEKKHYGGNKLLDFIFSD